MNFAICLSDSTGAARFAAISLRIGTVEAVNEVRLHRAGRASHRGLSRLPEA
jgi:hypothetical protein